jgi:enoyl-CoA hydratase/carnithine racemase
VARWSPWHAARSARSSARRRTARLPSLRLLHALLSVTAATDDDAEGVAAFREKRQPRWTGR